MSAVLPQLSVEAGGIALPPAEVQSLGEVRVQQRLSLPTQCVLTFHDLPASASRLEPGASLLLAIGGRSEPLFAGQVTAVERVYGPAHERELIVRGYDLLHRLRKRQTVRAHVQTTVADLARELTADMGIVVEAADPGPTWPLIVQHRQSDLDLLVEVAERAGLYLALRDGVLHLLTLAGVGEGISLVLGESLLEARIEVNGDPACRSVEVAGWDLLRVEPHGGTASSGQVGREVASSVSPDQVGGDGRRFLVNEALPSDRHAELLAQAELDRRVGREVIFWGAADGNPRLRPGTPVLVTGVGAPVEGRYVLTSATHTVDSRRGFISELSSLPPQPSTRDGGAFMTTAVIASVDDPERLGRVKVELPAIGNVETDWMGVLCPGAGPHKGFVALPDVGDRVLVLFPQDNPAQGIVLGGLYGMGGAPDSGVEAGSVRRYTLVTPDGQRIRLDDVGHAIRLEDRQGSFVELGPGKVRVHAATDLELEAPGRSVVIRGQAIDFQRG